MRGGTLDRAVKEGSRKEMTLVQSPEGGRLADLCSQRGAKARGKAWLRECGGGWGQSGRREVFGVDGTRSHGPPSPGGGL